jgi:hypothetical protein
MNFAVALASQLPLDLTCLVAVCTVYAHFPTPIVIVKLAHTFPDTYFNYRFYLGLYRKNFLFFQKLLHALFSLVPSKPHLFIPRFDQILIVNLCLFTALSQINRGKCLELLAKTYFSFSELFRPDFTAN